jgi:hypothetical protein
MKRLIVLLPVLLLAGVASMAMAGDFHYNTSLVCSDCHVMHYSQSHGYTVGGSVFPPLGPSGPYDYLLRNEQNVMCLACHNGQSWAPDVFGENITGTTRLAGGLNADPAHMANDGGYDPIDGHTLWSTAMPPGGTGTAYVPSTSGLECSDCHAVHGDRAYRNLLYRGIFAGDTITYAIGTNDLTKDVFERVAATYTYGNVDYNEPDITNSKYATWCKNCHVDFHGKPGDGNMGGGANPFKRHPTAGIDVSGTNLTTRYAVLTNKVKAMDSQGLWTGTGTDNTITPSCFSCHKSHGNQNAFGLVFMAGTGTITDNGDGGAFRDMCRQCHTRGNP